MSVRIWERLVADTPVGTVIQRLNDWMKTNGAVLTGGDRAAGALDATGTLTTGVAGSATIAGKSAGGVAATFAVEFQETFETVPADWLVLSGSRNQTVVGSGQTGGKAIRQTGPVAQAYPWTPFPYDATKLHRLRAKVRRVSGAGTFSYGVRAIDAAGAVLGTYALAALATAPGSSFTEYTGWLQGVGATTTPAPDAKTPSALPVGTVALQPYYALNIGDATGVMELDVVSYDRLDEDRVATVVNALISPNTTDPTDAARYAAGARTVPNAVDSDAIQVDVAIVGVLQSITDPTIFIDLRTTPAPGDIIVSLPGFLADNLGNAAFAGALSAATGTFAGSLTAATGTFAGSLTAATGTFAGSLSAASGTFSGTVTAASIVAAASFTAALATFTGDIGVVGTASFLTGADFGLGSFVIFRNGFAAASSAIDLLRVGTGGTSGASVALEVNSTTGGFMLPRMTAAQRNALTALAGLCVFNTTAGKAQCYDGAVWQDLF